MLRELKQKMGFIISCTRSLRKLNQHIWFGRKINDAKQMHDQNNLNFNNKSDEYEDIINHWNLSCDLHSKVILQCPHDGKLQDSGKVRKMKQEQHVGYWPIKSWQQQHQGFKGVSLVTVNICCGDRQWASTTPAMDSNNKHKQITKHATEHQEQPTSTNERHAMMKALTKEEVLDELKNSQMDDVKEDRLKNEEKDWVGEKKKERKKHTHECDVLYENKGRERDVIMHTLRSGQAVEKTVSQMHRRCREQENCDCRNSKGYNKQAAHQKQ